MLLVVICVAYVISDVSTHQLPIWYYEGFFTYLYGVSIFFLLYVFCFLLQGNMPLIYIHSTYRETNILQPFIRLKGLRITFSGWWL